MNLSKLHRQNNFDALRLLAAFFVLYSHQHAFMGIPEPMVFGSMTWGTLGVMIFFSISGFLVSRSWQQDPHAGRFLARRFLRVWPGLAVFTIVTALVLGPIATEWKIRDYFLGAEFFEFFENLKLVTVRTYLPGVFENNTFPRAVAGSIWTIPIEVRLYMLLALLESIGFSRKPIVVVVSTIAFAIYYFYFVRDPTDYQLHFALFFYAGVCLNLYREKWEKNMKSVLPMAGFLVLALWLLDMPRIALLISISSFSIFFWKRIYSGHSQIR